MYCDFWPFSCLMRDDGIILRCAHTAQQFIHKLLTRVFRLLRGMQPQDLRLYKTSLLHQEIQQIGRQGISVGWIGVKAARPNQEILRIGGFKYQRFVECICAK